MSLQEFQKLHDELKALRAAGNVQEVAARFIAKNSTVISSVHDPAPVLEALKLQSEKLGNAPIEVHLDEVTQIGDVVIDRSTVTVKLPSGDKHGWNLTVWVKEDGHWKVRNSATTFKH